MSNIDVNITLQQSKKVIRFNQIDGIGIIKEDGSMDFFDRVKESRISEMSREEISGLKEEIRVVVEEMAANGETITVLAVHEKTGIHKLFLEHCSVQMPCLPKLKLPAERNIAKPTPNLQNLNIRNSK